MTVKGETLTCTPEHPFYSPVKGWTSAIDLRAGDILVMLNGEYVVVEQVQHELLESPETTYNFEVEDYHTYYVGDTYVLVHNQCGDSPQSPVKLSKHELKGIDAHAFKQDMVGGSISRWDIFKDSANQNAIWLGDKAQKSMDCYGLCAFRIEKCISTVMEVIIWIQAIKIHLRFNAQY